MAEIGPDDIEISIVKDEQEIESASKAQGIVYATESPFDYILEKLDVAERGKQLGWLFHKNMKLQKDRKDNIPRVARLKGETTVCASVLWTPVEFEEIDKWTMIRYGGAMEIPFRLGRIGFARVLEVNDWYGKMWKEIMPDTKKDCISIERLTPHGDEFDKRGAHGAIVKKLLQESNIPARSPCNTKEDKEFFEKLGFKVVGERDYESHFHVWFMLWEPK